MGNCPCCPKRGGNYDPYVEEDDDYQSYDSPSTRGYKKPLVSTSTTNTHTNNYSHNNRPPDESTYIPPPLPPSRGTTMSIDPAQSQQPRNTPPTSTTPPRSTTPPHTQQQQEQQQQQQHYTQYSESLYLARQPEQPTDSMLLDSMMKSSFLQQRYPVPPSSSSFTESRDFDGGSSLVDSAYGSGSGSISGSISGSVSVSGSVSTTTHNSDFAASTQSPAFAVPSTHSPNMEQSTASLATSTSSSVYYDAPGYMMGSVNEGAFESQPAQRSPPPQ